jgi:hypothetical protein
MGEEEGAAVRHGAKLASAFTHELSSLSFSRLPIAVDPDKTRAWKEV